MHNRPDWETERAALVTALYARIGAAGANCGGGRDWARAARRADLSHKASAAAAKRKFHAKAGAEGVRPMQARASLRVPPVV